MLLDLNILQQELPALAERSMDEVRDLLASLGFPVDGAEAVDGTWVLEVDITANRGDALSQRGMARDLAAKLDAALAAIPTSPLTEGEALHPMRLEAEACPIYASAILELDRTSGTPSTVRTFLAHMGSNAKDMAPVDASNELLHRYGHPTHAFDADKLQGPVVVRWAREGETLVTLDGLTRTCTPKDLVITDDSGPIALAGVMGGDSTKVTETTRRVLLESAWFDPRVVRAMAHRHGLHTDASYRFGRGADPAFARTARTLLAERLHAWCGAKLVGAWTVGVEPAARSAVRLDGALVRRIAGFDIPMAQSAALLQRLGCTVTAEGEQLTVAPPSWRHDLAIVEDYAEEVLRLVGYEAIPMALPPLEGSPLPLAASYQLRRTVATRLAHLGFHQTVTLGFVSPEEDASHQMRLGRTDNPAEGRTLGNPLGQEYSVMRASLVPSLLRAAEANLRQGAKEVRLFEMGPVFRSTPEGPVEEATLAFLWGGTLGGEDYLSRPRAVLVADLLAVARDLGLQGDVAVTEVADGLYAVEVPLARMPVPELRIIPAFQPFSRFPAVGRDLSLLVGLDQPYQPLAEAMAAAVGRPELRDLRCVDVFRAKGLPDGKQAWLFRLKFQAEDRTLTGEEVDGWVASALAAAEAQGASLRA